MVITTQSMSKTYLIKFEQNSFGRDILYGNSPCLHQTKYPLTNSHSVYRVVTTYSYKNHQDPLYYEKLTNIYA